MAEQAPTLIEVITHGREERDLEYKGASGPVSFVWGSAPVNEKIARSVMAMANIGGGTIVIGMDQIGPDTWQPNGVSSEVAQRYEQDVIQQYVNQRADPYVRLSIRHVEHEAKLFVIMLVDGFDEIPVVCTRGGGRDLRQGAVYTRSFTKHESVEIQSQSEMRELLDRAIEIGIQNRLRPFDAVLELLRSVAQRLAPPVNDDQQFEAQRGEP